MTVLTTLFALVTATTATLLGGDGTDLVETPHGFRPSRCIIRHDESPVEITEIKGKGVKAWYPNSKRSVFFPNDPYCEKQARDLLAKRNGNQGLQTWEDYASFTTSTPVGNFTSTYQIPNESPTGGRQLLYYFIGFENKGDSASLIIYQPVVNYDLSGQYPKGWSMEPWNCCPSGQTHTGKNVVMGAGQSALAWIYASGGNGDVVIGQSKADGTSPTVLTVKNANRKLNWAGAVFEDIVASCAETTGKPFGCNDMVITGLNGKNVALNWKEGGQPQCKGGVVISNGGKDVAIYGHDKP
eukprot:226418_1